MRTATGRARAGWGAPCPHATRDLDSGLLTAEAFRAVGGHVLRRAPRREAGCGLVCVQMPAPPPGAPARRGRAGRVRLAAGLLAAETRAEDVLARTAPRELCALIVDADRAQVAEIAADVRAAFALFAALSRDEPGGQRAGAVLVGWAVLGDPADGGSDGLDGLWHAAQAAAR